MKRLKVWLTRSATGSRKVTATIWSSSSRNLAHALLFQGHYDKALAIYRQNWDKPQHGKTFGQITLEDFAAFDKAGLTHPDLSRMKRALGDLRSSAPGP